MLGPAEIFIVFGESENHKLTMTNDDNNNKKYNKGMLAKLIDFFRWSLVTVMVIVSAAFMLNASNGDSAIVDELAHIPAGYGYVRYLDYRLNPEHPPLVKAIAALPLLFSAGGQELNFPLGSLAWQKDVNGQWTVGTQFLYESGNDPDKIIRSARLGPIALTLILIIAVYFFSKELMGRWWALLPTFLTAFSPTILAHGHYVTTDVGSALGILLATWAFLNYLSRPSRGGLFIAGLAFGFAQLVKFSAFLLIPYFLILIALFYSVSVVRDWSTTDPAKGYLRRFFIRVYRYLRSVFLVFLIGFGAVFAVYFLFTINYPIEKQIADTEYILSGSTSLTTGDLRFLWLKDFMVWLAGVPVLRAAAEYVLGLIMVFQRSAGGNTLYFLGEVSNIGSPAYFPLTFLWKEPPASLVLILIAFLFSSWSVIKAAPGVVFGRSRKFLDYLTTNFAEFALLVFVIIYWAASITSNLNIGVRHILPTLPFIYILTAGAIRKWFSIKNLETTRNMVIKIFVVYREFWSVSAKTAILALLIIWYFLSAAITAPHFLSYFNFLSGGAKNGYQLVTDSNYDWGQDLKRLAQYIEQANNDDDHDNDIDRIAVDYFGGGNPKYYLGDRAEKLAVSRVEPPVVSRVEPWWSARGNPLNEGIKWLAVSANTIQIAKGAAVKGFVRNPEDEYQWLTEPYKFYDRAGTSIFIYKLEQPIE